MAGDFMEELGYEPRELQNPSIIEAFAAGVMAFGFEAVSKRLHKRGKTSLYGEMNPNGDQKKAKLSVDDAIEATRLTGNVTWLSMLAAELGYCLVPGCGKPDKPTVAEECTDDMIDLGAFTRVVNNPLATVQEVRAASLAVRKNIRETEALKIAEIEKSLSKAVK